MTAPLDVLEAFFHSWERRLAYRDDAERRTLPFEWGSDYLPDFPGWERPVPLADAEASRRAVHEHVEAALRNSHAYFADERPTDDYRLEGDRLTFPSPAPTDVGVNDLVHAAYYPASLNGRHAAGERGPAVLVLPQWNAKEGAQEGLCRLLNRFGLSALKLALPYHERRRPNELARADFTLSPNIGRTLQSCRQAVLDARAAIRWLSREGHSPIGIVGTSLGSCIAFIVFAHEPALEAGVFNHISPYFADVVWRGISTRHVRGGLERGIDLDELRRLWLPLSPYSYYEGVKSRGRPTLLVYGRYDLSFPVDLSRALLADFRKLGIEYEAFELPCGHYTTAKFPFNWMDGLRIARFLRNALRRTRPQK